MVYQGNAVKDAEAESMVLRKKLGETEESCRWERMLRESLTVRQRLKEEVEGLKLFLVNGWSRKSKI